ncbi:Hypothetical protein HDN1F_30190 [gamma proteobacterium HdN1]|nr:Hypothetical protein HDN1F_30190 [gamma proteobacterium HdN1]
MGLLLAMSLAGCSTLGLKKSSDAPAKPAESASTPESKSSMFESWGSLGDWSRKITGRSGKAKTIDDELAELDDTASTSSRKAAPIPLVIAPGAQKDAAKAESQYRQALTALNSGQEDQALVLLRDISNQYPNLSGPLLNQAILLRKKGRLEEARDLLQKSLLTPTQNPRVMNELGIVNRELGQMKQARAAYESAIRLAPSYDLPHYNLGVLADLYLQDLPLAIQEFEAYQALQETRDKRVDGWLKDLKRRVEKSQ